MKNRNFKSHQDVKSQQNHPPKFEAVPIMAKIEIPTKEDFVKILTTEYTGLVANNALLDAVKRIIVHDPYSNYTTLRTVLGMVDEKEEN